MAITKILVPDMGDFKDVEIIEVLVKEGQQIKKNDSLITLESDKSSVEVPSTHEGTIEKIEIKVGDKVNKGDLILSLNSEINIDAKKETINTTINEENKIQVKKNKPIKNKEIIPAIPSSKSGTKSASPKVRKFARELGANVVEIQGSQRGGRVSEDDVKKFIRSQVTVSDGKVEKKTYVEEYSHEEFGEIELQNIPRVKKLSGPQLVRSWTEIPHVTQHDEIDITEMDQFRSSLYDYYTKEMIKVTPLAFITKALVNALKEFPNFKFYMVLSDALPDDNWVEKKDIDDPNGDGFVGFVHQAVIDQYLSKHEAPEDIEYYFCGPPMMNQAVLKMCDDWGVPPEQVRFDDFGG